MSFLLLLLAIGIKLTLKFILFCFSSHFLKKYQYFFVLHKTFLLKILLLLINNELNGFDAGKNFLIKLLYRFWMVKTW